MRCTNLFEVFPSNFDSVLISCGPAGYQRWKGETCLPKLLTSAVRLLQHLHFSCIECNIFSRMHIYQSVVVLAECSEWNTGTLCSIYCLLHSDERFKLQYAILLSHDLMLPVSRTLSRKYHLFNMVMKYGHLACLFLFCVKKKIILSIY